MKASKFFRFAHGGHTVRDYPAGAELPPDAALWAVENGYAQQADNEKQPEPAKAPAKRWSKK